MSAGALTGEAGAGAGAETEAGAGTRAGTGGGAGIGGAAGTEGAVVAAALDRLADERLHVLAVTGAAGTGKSRLLAEAGRLAGERGLLVLAGRVPGRGEGRPGERGEAGRSGGLGGSGAGLGSSASAAAALALAPLTRRLSAPPSPSSLTPPGSSGTSRAGRRSAHDIVREVLEDLAPPGLAVLIDDVHRADDRLIDVLLDLFQRPPSTTALIVLAYSPQLGAARLHRAVIGGGYPCPVEWLPLPSARVSALLPSPRHADDSDPTSPDPRGSLRAAHPAEFDTLPPSVRTAGWAAAVVGEAFEIALLAAITDAGLPDAVAAVDELVRCGLIRPVAGTGRFAFRDRATWQATYSSADPAWRVAAHARAVTALRRKGAGATSLAPHLEFAATMGDQEAVSVLAAAARTARATAPLVCARWLRAALRLLPQHAYGTRPRTRLLVELADVLADAGRLVESRDLLHRVMETVEQDAPDLRGFVTARCARIERLLCHHEEGRALLLRAVSTRPAADDDAQPLFAFELALAELADGALGDSRRWTGVALTAADRRETRTLKAAALGLAGLVDTLGGDVGRGAELADSCARMVDGLTDSEVLRMPQAAGLLGWSEWVLGRRTDALRHLDRGISASRAAGNTPALTELLIGRSLVLRDAGRLAEAADTAQTATELATSSGSDQQLVLALAAHCSAATWLGNQKLALSSGDAATSPRERPAGRRVRVFAQWMHAEARAAAGHLDAGTDLVDALGGPDLLTADPWSRLYVYELLTRIAVASGDVAEAMDWASLAEAAAINPPGRIGTARQTRTPGTAAGLPGLYGTAQPQALSVGESHATLAHIQTESAGAQALSIGESPSTLAETAAIGPPGRIGIARLTQALSVGKPRSTLAETAPIGLPGRVGIARLARAQALAVGDPGAALGYALAAAEALDAAGLPLDAARARLAAGSAAGRDGRADEAATQLKRAQAVFEAHGARRWFRLAVAERRRLAGGAPRSGKAARSVLGRLTRREQQVAALVSQGLSNRRVAQQLYIAEKTVEMHLSNIFAKLSVASRTEMARIVMAG